VEPDTLDPPNAKECESVLVLEPPELTLDG
jgi:hypothetical protein